MSNKIQIDLPLFKCLKISLFEHVKFTFPQVSNINSCRRIKHVRQELNLRIKMSTVTNKIRIYLWCVVVVIVVYVPSY